MGNGSSSPAYIAPILVVGLGNSAAGDEALGSTLLEELSKGYRYAGHFVEFLDGGTRGLDLLGQIAGRPAVVFLDAIAADDKPGTVRVWEDSDVLRYATGGTPNVHAGDARELLATAAFLGDLPEHFYLVGVQPSTLHEGKVLSGAVQGALASAVSQAQRIVDRLLVEMAEPVEA
jgi:hydrogenase maturation protease